MGKEKWFYHNYRYKHSGICTDVRKHAVGTLNHPEMLVYYVDENGDEFEEYARDVRLEKVKEEKNCVAHYSFF